MGQGRGNTQTGVFKNNGHNCVDDQHIDKPLIDPARWFTANLGNDLINNEKRYYAKALADNSQQP